MSAGLSTDLQQFALFIQSKLNAGQTKLSPEEVLDEWRDEHPTDEEFEESVSAIQESLAEMDAGAKGKSAEQLRREFSAFRQSQVLPATSRDEQP